MKNIILLIITLITFSCGTDQGEGKTYVYTLENGSGRNIKIDAYKSSTTDMKPETLYLEEGKAITKTFQSPDPPLQEYYDFIYFFQGDSIVVNYNNEKKQIFVLETCEGSERNPLNICIYSDQEETFTFTEEDYENAIPCDGDCD